MLATSFSLFPYPQRGSCGVLIILDVPAIPGRLSFAKSSSVLDTRLHPPRLPWDLLLIFNQCDPSTLAQLGRVSHDFLVAMARPLYGRIEISSVDALRKLFCERLQSSSSRINPHLALSRTQTLVLDFSYSSLSPPVSPPKLVFDRITHSDPLPLDLLSISSHFKQHHSLEPTYSSLLPHLNPTRFNFIVAERPLTSSSWLSLGVPPLLSWNRIHTLDFHGVIPFSFHGGIGGLPSPSNGRRRVVKLHVSTLFFQRHESAELILRALARNGIVVGMEFMQPGSIVLLVRSEEERREVELAVLRLNKTKQGVFLVDLER